MIDALVFSKDRAAQLDLLLRSIARHAPGVYEPSSFQVLYTTSSEEHEAGYRLLGRHHPAVMLLREGDDTFERDVRSWLELGPDNGQVSFLVDDDVFYRAAHLPAWLPWSYRGADFDYPFSVDGNVYRRDDVTRLLDGLPFGCPTELEWFAHEHRARLPFQAIRPPLYSCLVGVPANRVASLSAMPCRDDLMLSPDALLERYLDGARLELAVEPPPGAAHLHVGGPLPYRWSRWSRACEECGEPHGRSHLGICSSSFMLGGV